MASFHDYKFLAHARPSCAGIRSSDLLAHIPSRQASEVGGEATVPGVHRRERGRAPSHGCREVSVREQIQGCESISLYDETKRYLPLSVAGRMLPLPMLFVSCMQALGIRFFGR